MQNNLSPSDYQTKHFWNHAAFDKTCDILFSYQYLETIYFFLVLSHVVHTLNVTDSINNQKKNKNSAKHVISQLSTGFQPYISKSQ